MTARALIRQGDRTTHGGTVLTGDPTLIIHGRQAARVGDAVYCPMCKKTGRIITGAPTMWDSQLVARHDDLTDCGAKLIASQATDVYDDGNDDGAGLASAALAARPDPVGTGTESSGDVQDRAAPDPADEHHAIRFQAIDPETGVPIPRCVYIVTRENGMQHGGVTDKNGFTETFESSQQEQIAIHFAFTSPTGQVIDRENLT